MNHAFLPLKPTTSVRVRPGAMPTTLLWGVLCFAAACGAAAAQYETPPVLKAAEVLPADLRSGPDHRVGDEVISDGYMNHYTISSRFGSLKADSTADLRKKVQELRAVAVMEGIQVTQEYASAVRVSGTRAVDGMKTLVTQPVDTIAGAAAGIGRLFQRAGETLSGGRSEAEDRRVQQLIGFSKTKREYAHQFGVDVYASNPILQARLDDVAWAGYFGGLTVGAAMALIPGGAGVAVSASGATRLLNDVMRDNAPTDLRRMNRGKLEAMGVSVDVAGIFIDNAAYSPRQQTVLVDALEELSGTAGRGLFIRFAAADDSEDLAFFRQRQAQMYASYHQKISHIDRFVAVGRIVGARTRDGTVMISAPTDYLVWTRELAGLVQEAGEGLANSGKKELWVAGKVSPLARRSLEGLGWTVREDGEARLLVGAPL